VSEDVFGRPVESGRYVSHDVSHRGA